MDHAKYCYANYRTIENCIPKTPNKYDLSLESYAIIDNTLTKSQMAIGQTSNMAQLALTYTYNFTDRKYLDSACILSVLAQAAIDNAKRTSDIVFSTEIKRLNEIMEVETNKLPLFWQITKKDKRKSNSEEQRRQRVKANKEKIRKNLNKNLICPMNYLYSMDFNSDKSRADSSTLPMSYFFVNYPSETDRRKSKAVEELIEKYSIQLYNFNSSHTELEVNWDEDKDQKFLLMEDFDELINDIKQIYISKNYRGLMSWLINRAFYIGAGVRAKKDVNMDSTISENRSILLKVLYSINPDCFLECFKTCTTIEN